MTSIPAVLALTGDAPTNLEVPPHKYLADSKLLIGEDDTGTA